jgi:hypothetical protein
MMRKYPVLRGLSALARLVGWVGLILAGILILIGVAQFLSSVNSTSQYQSGMGYFGVYTSFAAFSLGLGLLIGSIYLIILGPVDKPSPNTDASEQDESDEAGGEFVIPSGDAPLLLEMANEAFNP